MRSKLWVSWANVGTVRLTNRAAAVRGRRIISSLHQWSWVFQIAVPYGVGSPIRERAYRVGRVVAVILRKHRRAAGHKDIVHVPTLAITIEDAGCGIDAHDRT